MKISKPLAKFLAEEGALTIFVDNHVNQYGKDNTFIIRGVGSGFTWYKTPEGYEYWSRLNETFIVYEII
jgi:hypothetical protein